MSVKRTAELLFRSTRQYTKALHSSPSLLARCECTNTIPPCTTCLFLSSDASHVSEEAVDTPHSVSRDLHLSSQDPFETTSMASLKEMLDARVHLGHKKGMWNPLMKPYLFGTKDDVHVFDLEKTQSHLRLALNVAGHIAYKNGIILFVNERSQFDRLVQQTARDCGEYFVTPKWRPGTLTNSQMLLGTLRHPDLIIFLSTGPSKTAIKEASMSNIPTVAITDSDADPRLIVYPVPGNDDTPSAITLYCQLFSEVIQRAKKLRTKVGVGEGGGMGSYAGTLVGKLNTDTKTQPLL